MNDLERVLRQHELGRADFVMPPDSSGTRRTVNMLVCRGCRHIAGPFYDWQEFAGHLAHEFEDDQA